MNRLPLCYLGRRRRIGASVHPGSLPFAGYFRNEVIPFFFPPNDGKQPKSMEQDSFYSSIKQSMTEEQKLFFELSTTGCQAKSTVHRRLGTKPKFCWGGSCEVSELSGFELNIKKTDRVKEKENRDRKIGKTKKQKFKARLFPVTK